jgi:hypothetical protein
MSPEIEQNDHCPGRNDPKKQLGKHKWQIIKLGANETRLAIQRSKSENK